MDEQAQAAWKKAKEVSGWLSPREAEALFCAARSCPQDQAIVEIGSWKGKSTIMLSLGAKQGKKAHVWAVDPHSGSQEHQQRYGTVSTFEQFQQHLENAGAQAGVTAVRMMSVAAASQYSGPTIGVLFIDGAHDPASVAADIAAWLPYLHPGATVLFHDTTVFPGVKQVVKTQLRTAAHWVYPVHIDTIMRVQHGTPNTVQIMQIQWFLWKWAFRDWLKAQTLTRHIVRLRNRLRASVEARRAPSVELQKHVEACANIIGIQNLSTLSEEAFHALRKSLQETGVQCEWIDRMGAWAAYMRCTKNGTYTHIKQSPASGG